jgi:outer membrane autotransporter protein
MTHYSYYDAQDYTETGAGGANLNVDQDSLSMLEVGAGLETGWDLKSKDGTSFSPELRAGYRYDLIGDNFNAASNFTGGGGSFNTQGVDPTRGTLSLGGGLTYYTISDWELSANYEFEHKTDYNSNSGFLRAAYQF